MKKINYMIKNFIIKVQKKNDVWEYEKIFHFLRRNFDDKNLISILDVGSGNCDFEFFLSKKLNNVIFYCVDINNDLVKLALSNGFKAIKANILELPFENNLFDVVHCSHVIEHLYYPDIVKAIDELVRVTKPGGFIIIRSPLWANHRFFHDIDHIRPYPPQAILNYFNNLQQQKRNKVPIKKVAYWKTRPYLELDPNQHDSYLIKILNLFFKISWYFFKFPYGRYNCYGLILTKLSEDTSQEGKQ